MKLIICKRVPIFALNPNVEVVCVDEDTRDNEVFAITQENREKAVEIVNLFNKYQDDKEKS